MKPGAGRGGQSRGGQGGGAGRGGSGGQGRGGSGGQSRGGPGGGAGRGGSGGQGRGGFGGGGQARGGSGTGGYAGGYSGGKPTGAGGRPGASGGKPSGAGRPTGTGGPARSGGKPAGTQRGRGTPPRPSSYQLSARSAARPLQRSRPAYTEPQIDVHDPDGVRLQKILAGAGVGSRRTCENLITAGRVTVDGHLVTELGVRVDPARVVIHVDGVRVQLDPDKEYLAFNKPLDVVSTMSDELGRPCVGDFLLHRGDRLFHVGRLDADTDGLLLLTNDGELANRLQHPSYGVLKTYVATVPGPVARDVGARLRAGVELEEGLVVVDSFRLVDSGPGKALVEVVLHEGGKHVVRRLLEAVGHPVLTLTRVQVGPIRLGELRTGKVRPLNSREVGELYKAAGL